MHPLSKIPILIPIQNILSLALCQRMTADISDFRKSSKNKCNKKVKTLFNYHTHTVFCGHAENTVDEMCEKAIELGFSEIGFSEHYDRDLRGECRGKLPFDPKEYAKSVKKAKEKYKDRIKVLLGAEMDFYLYNYLDVYKEILEMEPDYILGSVHRVKGFSFSKGHIPFIYLSEKETEIILKEYLGTLISMINSGCVNCLDHFDIFKRS